MTEVLTDEQAALIWSAAPITKLEEITPKADPSKDPPKDPVDDDNEDPNEGATPSNDIDSITAALLAKKDEDEDTTQIPAGTPAKPGRKTTDFVSSVNKLIKDGKMLPFKESEEVKTNEEAIELLNLNLVEKEKEGREGAWTEKLKSYSPQIQAILQYAEQGAQSASEIMELMGAIKQIEDSYELDDKTPKGQEDIVRQYYKSKGFKDAAVEKQVTLLKDAGLENVREAAEMFLPEIIQENEKKVAQQMAIQQGRQRQAEEASRIYLTTVKDALAKDLIGEIPMDRTAKAQIFEAVANPKFKSINGTQTTQFVKTLEDLQFGENKNYEHFLNVVRYTVDPKGFMESVEKTIKAKVEEKTQKELRTSKTTKPNSEYEENTSTKKTVSKGFVNPYA